MLGEKLENLGNPENSIRTGSLTAASAELLQVIFFMQNFFLAQTLTLCYPTEYLELSAVDVLKSFIFIRTCPYVINVPLF